MLECILVCYMNLTFSFLVQSIVSASVPLIWNNRVYEDTHQFSPPPPLLFWANAHHQILLNI